jgi:hypothetical protein
MDELLTSIATKKQRLDELRPLSPQVLANLEHYYDIELTYTSNAIEGNTLSQLRPRWLLIGTAVLRSPYSIASSTENWAGKGTSGIEIVVQRGMRFDDISAA